MNKILTDIPNKIKQSAQCCKYCGKSYIKKTNLDKHVIICELINNSKTKTTIDDDEEVPSQRKMYQMILEIGKKLNGLDEKVDELNKWVIRKKKKINVVEWLNNHIKPDINFDNLIEKIIIEKDDILHLFQNTFADTLNHIFSRNIYNVSESEFPVFAFVQKSNVFYIYENEEAGWLEINREKLVRFLNRVHTKLYRHYIEWKKENRLEIDNDEKLSLLCDKTTCKMMDVDFRQEAILGKIRANMYGRMKTDMKALVEYDFEF
jgi:hypothetical protein